MLSASLLWGFASGTEGGVGERRGNGELDIGVGGSDEYASGARALVG